MLLDALLLLSSLQAPATDLATIRKELAQAESAFQATLAKVSDAGREKAYSAWAKQQDEFYAQAEALAAAHPKEELACEALVWIVSSLGPGDRASRSFERLLADFPKSERLAEIPQPYVWVDLPFVDDWYARLAAAERPDKVRGAALFASAQRQLRAIDAARRLRKGGDSAEHVRETSSKEWLAKIEPLDPEAETQAVDALLESVRKEFADVDAGQGKFGQLAQAALHELRDLAIGKQAPEIEGKDLEGAAFKLSEYRGKVVLLAFWGDWWGPCRAMYRHERSLVEELKSEPFAIVGVNSDSKQAELRELQKKENITWRSFFDGGGAHGPIATEWNISRWPTVYVLDAQGRIRFKNVRGPELEAAIDELLAELKAGKPGATGR